MINRSHLKPSGQVSELFSISFQISPATSRAGHDSDPQHTSAAHECLQLPAAPRADATPVQSQHPSLVPNDFRWVSWLWTTQLVCDNHFIRSLRVWIADQNVYFTEVTKAFVHDVYANLLNGPWLNCGCLPVPFFAGLSAF